MQDRTKLTLARAIKSNALTDRQKLNALRAIKADAPDEDVRDLITSLSFKSLRSGNRSLDEMIDQKSGKDRQNFDYASGADGKLRGLMSFGETAGDKEAILTANVGSDGFIRDAGGRLALTEAGQKRRGMEFTGKNVIIEDEGFSARDFSDLAGMVPETVGSIIGAVGGTIAGGLPGGVVGAGAGGAAGQAIEEAIESLFGVQTQTGGQIARDIAIEGAIGAGGELLGAGVFLAGRSVLRGGKAVAGKVAGRTPGEELAEDTVDRAYNMVMRVDADGNSMGYVPSYEAMGANKAVGYVQKLAETAGRNQIRMQRNLDAALKEKDEFLKGNKEGFTKVGDDVRGEFGEDIMFNAPGAFNRLTTAQTKAKKAHLKAMDDEINFMRSAIKEDYDLNPEMMGTIVRTFGSFEDVSRQNFKLIDDKLDELNSIDDFGGTILFNGEEVAKSGNKWRVFDINKKMQSIDPDIPDESIKGIVQDIFEGSRGLTDEAILSVKSFTDDFSDGMLSFENMATLRKTVNDNLFFNPATSTQGLKGLRRLREKLDLMLDPANISISAPSLRGTRAAQVFSEAEILRNRAISGYRDGFKRFDELANVGIIRSVKQLKDSENGLEKITDKFFEKVVQADSPQRLRTFFDAVGPKDINVVQDAMGRRWIDDALKNSKFYDGNPDAFSGSAFNKKIQDLGSTGKVLFGKDWDRMKSLATQISNTNLKTTTTADVLRATEAGGTKNLLDSLQKVADTAADQRNALRFNVIKGLEDSNLSLEDAVNSLTNPKLMDSEVASIMKFFNNKPDMLDRMRKIFVSDILSSVDEKILSSRQASGSMLTALEKYKPGVLRRVLGEEQEKALRYFAKDLEMLGDVGKEGAIAAGSLWSKIITAPFQALSQLGKFRMITKFMASPENAKRYLEIRKSTRGDPAGRTQALASFLNEAAIKEGVDINRMAGIAGRAGMTGAKVTGAGIKGARRVIPQALQEQELQKNPLPNVQPSSLGQNIDLFQGPTQTNVRPAKKLSPIEQIQRNAQQISLRERAAQNPAVAASLLGGLGNAGLL